MRIISLLTIQLAITLAGKSPEKEIDLSHVIAQHFPTSSVDVKGCNAAYDSGDQSAPPSCRPFPVEITISGMRPDAADSERLALAVSVQNVSNHPVELPRSVEEVRAGGKQTFIVFEMYSPPRAKTAISISYAFADTNRSSSVVQLNSKEAITYLLPLDRRALQKDGDTGHAGLKVVLRAYSLNRAATNLNDGVSRQIGNEISSEPFTVK